MVILQSFVRVPVVFNHVANFLINLTGGSSNASIITSGLLDSEGALCPKDAM